MKVGIVLYHMVNQLRKTHEIQQTHLQSLVLFQPQRPNDAHHQAQLLSRRPGQCHAILSCHQHHVSFISTPLLTQVSDVILIRVSTLVLKKH